VCKLRPLERRFPADFREWIANLERLYLWRKAGYPLRANDLEWEAWQALAIITRYHEVKDLEAMIPRQQAVKQHAESGRPRTGINAPFRP
jgi:hypothetical protein